MKTAVISYATASTGEIVAAVTGRKIRVLGYMLVAAGSVVATWKSGSTAISGAMSMVVGVPVPAPLGGTSLDPMPHFITNAGEALNLTLSGAVQVSGHITYDVID